MIIEFTEDVPIPDSRKSFKAGQRMAFEKERGQQYVKAGQAREVKKLYPELPAPKAAASMEQQLDALTGTKKKKRTKPKKDKP